MEPRRKGTQLLSIRKRIRRGRGAKNVVKNKMTTFSILGCNANGLKAKIDSLRNVMTYFDYPSVICIQ